MGFPADISVIKLFNIIAQFFNIIISIINKKFGPGCYISYGIINDRTKAADMSNISLRDMWWAVYVTHPVGDSFILGINIIHKSIIFGDLSWK